MARKSGKALRTVMIIAVLTAVAGIAVLAWLAGRPAPAPGKKVDVAVYFSDEEGLFLKAEKRSIDSAPLEEEMVSAMEELFKGPSTAALGATIPEGTRLLALRLDGRTAVVDLSGELVRNHPGGSSGEIQTVYSIVNTITLNFPEAASVQILVDGKKVSTIAGHIDTTMPLGPDKKVIKGS